MKDGTMKAILCTALLMLLTACAGGDRGLRDLRSNGGGPDEFQVLPTNPLILPDDITNFAR